MAKKGHLRNSIYLRNDNIHLSESRIIVSLCLNRRVINENSKEVKLA